MRSLTNFCPSTFEERGAAVAFTTPTLAQTRIRLAERDQMEVMIPNLSEGRGVYVVALKSLGLAFPLTVHDRMLQDFIVQSGGCSPEDIRKSVLETARLGLAGPDAADAAEAALKDEEEQRLLINFHLIVEVLKAVGLESSDLLRAGLASEAGQSLTRSYMTTASQKLGMEPQELYLRVAELAGAIEALGLPSSPKPARLRRLLRELVQFRDSMADWATDNVSEAAPIGGFCAEVAEHTLNHARTVIERLDRAMGSFESLLRQWETNRRDIRHGCARLSWLLDGWHFITTLWAGMASAGRYEQAMAVNEIFRIIPLLPKQESLQVDLSLAADKVAGANRKSVRAYVDWRTGQLDADLVMRIESINSKAA